MLSTFMIWFYGAPVAKAWSLPNRDPEFLTFYNKKFAAKPSAYGNRMNVWRKPSGAASELEDLPCRQRRLFCMALRRREFTSYLPQASETDPPSKLDVGTKCCRPAAIVLNGDRGAALFHADQGTEPDFGVSCPVDAKRTR